MGAVIIVLDMALPVSIGTFTISLKSLLQV